MQADQRAELQKVLERHQGDFELVARALQTTPQELRERVAADPWLKARWLDGGVNVHDRPNLAVPLELVEGFKTNPLPARDQALLDGVNAQDDKLKRLDWEALGIDPQKQSLLQEFEKFVGGKIVRTLDATHGGMLFVFAQTAGIYQTVVEKLKTIPSESEDGQVLFDQQATCAQLLIKLNAEATKAGHLRVMMEAKAREAEGKRRTKKPGFGKPRSVAASGSTPGAQATVAEKVETFVP